MENLITDNLIKVLKESCQVQSIEFMPTLDSLLSIKHLDKYKTFYVRPDHYFGKRLLSSNQLDINKLEYLKKYTDSSSNKFCLVDIGSNIGLFSRQCIANITSIDHIYCYEPEPQNFEMLNRNIGFSPRVKTFNIALSNTQGTLIFYLDSNNAGNYSLDIDAMRGTEYTSTTVIVDNVINYETLWKSHNLPIIYKSDTQGHDEIIATSLSMDFWQKVEFGYFELWQLADKNYDKVKFKTILDSFPNKILEMPVSGVEIKVDSDQVISFLEGNKWEFGDLRFWR